MTDSSLESITTCAYVGCAPEFVEAFNAYLKLFRRCGLDFDAYSTVDDFMTSLSGKKHRYVLVEVGMPPRIETVRDSINTQEAVKAVMGGGFNLLAEIRKSSLNGSTPVVLLDGRNPNLNPDLVDAAYRAQTKCSLTEDNANFIDAQKNLPFELVERIKTDPGIGSDSSIAFVYANNDEKYFIVAYKEELGTELVKSGTIDEFTSVEGAEQLLAGEKKYDLVVIDPKIAYKTDPFSFGALATKLVSVWMAVPFDLYDRLRERASREESSPQLLLIDNPKIGSQLIDAAFKGKYGKSREELGIKLLSYFKGSVVDRLVRLQDDFRTFPTSLRIPGEDKLALLLK